MASGIIRMDEGWRFDEGHHFDQPPNVPPPAPPPVLPQTKKGKPMDYIPAKRDPRYQWLKKLSDNVAAEAAKFGAPAADATAVKAAADDLLGKMDATNAAAAALDGTRSVETAAQAADQATIRAFIRNWKTLPLYPASGSEAVLGLKANQPATPGADFKPVLKVSIEAGKVRLDFVRGAVDALAIYSRLRGTATFHRLAVDTGSPYFDTTPLAQPGVPEVREYMARPMVGDEEVGQDSDIVSIPFGG